MSAPVLRRSLAVLALCLGVVQPAHAQCTTGNNNNASCSVSVTPTLTIGKLAQLEVNSPSTFSLAPSGGTITAADYITGSYDVGSTLVVTARANATWSVTVSATSSTFTAPCAGKAAGDLRWGRTATTRTTPMTTSTAQVFASATNAATAGAVQQLFFNVALTWAGDAPGTCTLPLSFAITAP